MCNAYTNHPNVSVVGVMPFNHGLNCLDSKNGVVLPSWNEQPMLLLMDLFFVVSGLSGIVHALLSSTKKQQKKQLAKWCYHLLFVPLFVVAGVGLWSTLWQTFDLRAARMFLGFMSLLVTTCSKPRKTCKYTAFKKRTTAAASNTTSTNQL